MAVHTRDINVSLVQAFPRAYAAVKFLCNTRIQETYLFGYNIDSVRMSGDLAGLFIWQYSVYLLQNLISIISAENFISFASGGKEVIWIEIHFTILFPQVQDESVAAWLFNDMNT